MRLSVAELPTEVQSEESVPIETDTEDGVGFDLDKGGTVNDAREDLHLAFGLSADRGAFTDLKPIYDECVELLSGDIGDILWATTNKWACILTDEKRVAAVRFIAVQRVTATPLVLRYTIQFVTWDAPPGTF